LQTFQQQGSDTLMTHFLEQNLGASPLRELIKEMPPTLEVIGKSRS
jgi:hypothetical protein